MLAAAAVLAGIAAASSRPAEPVSHKSIHTVNRERAEVSVQRAGGGKIAAYLVRWVSGTAEAGQWSLTAQAMVAA